MEDEQEKLEEEEVCIVVSDAEIGSEEALLTPANIGKVAFDQPEKSTPAWKVLLDAYNRGVLPLPAFSGIRPYDEFFSGYSSPPINPRSLAGRMADNYERFSVNYKAVWLALALYSIVVTPMLFFLIAFGAGYMVYKRYSAPGDNVTHSLLGKEVIVTDDYRIQVVATSCSLLAVVTGAAAVLIPASLFSLAFVVGHMVVHSPKEVDLFGEPMQQETPT